MRVQATDLDLPYLFLALLLWTCLAPLTAWFAVIENLAHIRKSNPLRMLLSKLFPETSADCYSYR